MHGCEFVRLSQEPTQIRPKAHMQLHPPKELSALGGVMLRNRTYNNDPETTHKTSSALAGIHPPLAAGRPPVGAHGARLFRAKARELAREEARREHRVRLAAVARPSEHSERQSALGMKRVQERKVFAVPVDVFVNSFMNIGS